MAKRTAKAGLLAIVVNISGALRYTSYVPTGALSVAVSVFDSFEPIVFRFPAEADTRAPVAWLRNVMINLRASKILAQPTLSIATDMAID